MGALWETLAFIIHTLGTKDQQVIGYSIAWTLLFLLAPLWINAYAYMTFARMVQYWHPQQKVFLRARTIGMWFVLADIISFIIQAAGGVMASPGNDPEYIKRGLDIYTGGTALQQFFIFIFIGLMIVFQRQVSQLGYSSVGEMGGVAKKSFKPLLFALYGTLLFITVSLSTCFLRFLTCCVDIWPIDPYHVPHRRVRQGLRSREPDSIQRGLHLRAGLPAYDDCALDPGYLPSRSVSCRSRERVPQAVEEGEEGDQDGEEGGKESCQGEGHGLGVF